uniref:NADH dehydrogenase subunit 6 n=1 Tax=Leucauge wulingensis TaxID=2918496 RepID=UPI001FA7B6F9|nr:NADH dehydrogenase subunit 6 [Leucauge wulingensis]ULD67701.1 NADH dehydrogenase subunit 6 [Leucauge wulingensis]
MKILFLGIMFLLGAQPILLMGMLIMMVLIYSFNVYMVMGNFWFSYILMLVMLTGVLVLFSYMLSLIPNSEFEFGSMFLVLVFLLMGYLIGDIYYSYLDYSDYSIFMWIPMMNMMTFFYIFLFGMMIIVVWLSMMDKGSIRE